MNRDRVMIVGANGALGRALLDELGPRAAIAATRSASSPAPGFQHVQLGAEGAPPAEFLRRCRAVINAAGCIEGDNLQLEAANVRLPVALAQAAALAGVPKMVQVSSFSVVGFAEHIDDTTPVRPVNAYGRSKAAADCAIAALATQEFAIESLRLPFMFSAARPGLLSPLLSLCDRLGVLPSRSDRPVQRSMITYAGAARALIARASCRRSGYAYAADARLFDYSLLLKVLAEEAGKRIRVVEVPGPVTSLMKICAPNLARRLFRSSILAPSSNLSANEPSRLEEELRLLVASR